MQSILVSQIGAFNILPLLYIPCQNRPSFYSSFSLVSYLNLKNGYDDLLVFRYKKLILILLIKNWSLVVVSGLISLGLLLFTFHSTEFHLFGFILVMMASFSSGLRWTLAQVVTQKHELGLGNPIDMIYHIQPTMIVALVPLASYVEGVKVVTSDKFFRTDDIEKLMTNSIWILCGAFLAFLLESSEYLVVSYTSSITLSISGIFKVITKKQQQ